MTLVRTVSTISDGLYNTGYNILAVNGHCAEWQNDECCCSLSGVHMTSLLM